MVDQPAEYPVKNEIHQWMGNYSKVEKRKTATKPNSKAKGKLKEPDVLDLHRRWLPSRNNKKRNVTNEIKKIKQHCYTESFTTMNKK